MATSGDRRVSWLDLSRERLFSHTAVNLISHKEHKNCLHLSAHRPQVVLQEHITAICLSGIPRKKCNASLKQRVPKSSSLSCLLPSTMMPFWKYGISALHSPRVSGQTWPPPTTNAYCRLLHLWPRGMWLD